MAAPKLRSLRPRCGSGGFSREGGVFGHRDRRRGWGSEQQGLGLAKLEGALSWCLYNATSKPLANHGDVNLTSSFSIHHGANNDVGIGNQPGRR